ncbi:MAG TPA: helix-hairpin-helix domain-containing protein [Candidatus Dormibacteraeota bacterium]|nr:helix-hairpin-helix domain-containing protein [Candidatus Dormibacteraeota bacterium]
MAAERLAVILAAMVFCAGASARRRKVLPSHPIDLNHSTLDQLEELPDVGPSMAHSILRFRRLSGPFERVEDLLAIRGISRRRFDKIRPYVFVGKSPSQSRGRRSSPAPPPKGKTIAQPASRG